MCWRKKRDLPTDPLFFVLILQSLSEMHRCKSLFRVENDLEKVSWLTATTPKERSKTPCLVVVYDQPTS